MLLKERILAVHVRAVKQSVAVHDIVPEAFVDVRSVVVFFAFEIILVRRYVFRLGRCLGVLLGGLFHGAAGKAVVQVNKNIGPVNLHE